jgi:hypothetical protein
VRFLALGVVVSLVALFAPRLIAQDDAGTPVCEIHGHLTIPRVHVFRSDGHATLETITDRDVRLTPLRRDAFRVHTADEGDAIAGSVEATLPFALAAEQTFGGVVTVAAGTRIESLEPVRGGGLRGDLPLRDGVTLSRVSLACADVVATETASAATESFAIPRGPTWHSRVARLRLRPAADDDSPAVALAIGEPARAQLVFVERQRREGWVRVEVGLVRARISAWVRDTDLQHL